MDTINPLTSIIPVGSSTSQQKGQQQEQQAPFQGQLLKALVLEAKGGNRFILDIGGNRQPVRSEAQLSPGHVLRLQVVKTEPTIELKIISNPLGALQGRSLTLLGKSIDLAGLFQNFQQQSPPPLETLSPPSRSVLENFFSVQQGGIEGKNGGIILKQLVNNLGLNLEQLLARGDKGQAAHTLKAALLELAQTFKSANNIAETTNKILTTLELFQLVRLQLGNENQLIIPLPLPFIEQGYLVVEQDDKDCTKKSTGEESRFALHLTVSELGNLQIDFLQNREGLFIRFRADDPEKAAFIEQFSDELKESISDFPLINITFSSDAPDPIHDLVRQLVPNGNSMLDTTV